MPFEVFSHCFLYNCVHETQCFPSNLGFCDLCVSHVQTSGSVTARSCCLFSANVPAAPWTSQAFWSFASLWIQARHSILHLCGITLQNSDKQTRCWGLCIQGRWPGVITAATASFQQPQCDITAPLTSTVEFSCQTSKRKLIQTVYTCTSVLVDFCMVLHHHYVHLLSD